MAMGVFSNYEGERKADRRPYPPTRSFSDVTVGAQNGPDVRTPTCHWPVSVRISQARSVAMLNRFSIAKHQHGRVTREIPRTVLDDVQGMPLKIFQGNVAECRFMR
jgi:hypothetical protein